LSNYLTPQSF